MCFGFVFIFFWFSDEQMNNLIATPAGLELVLLCTLDSAICLIAFRFIVSGSGHLSIKSSLDVNSDKMMFTCSFHSPAILIVCPREAYVS